MGQHQDSSGLGSDTVVHIIDNILFYKQYRITNMIENYIHTQTYLHESPQWTMNNEQWKMSVFWCSENNVSKVQN